MSKFREVEGTYGSGKTPSTIFVADNSDGSSWYVAEGGSMVNKTYDTIEDGVDIEELSDVDVYTMPKPINSLSDLEASLEDEEYAKGGAIKSEDLLEKLKGGAKISEQEVNLIKTRLNSGKGDVKELVQWIWDNQPELTSEQSAKGVSFLKNLWKSPTGKERNSNPFGYREQEILETSTGMSLDGFHDVSKYGSRGFYIPLYSVSGKLSDGAPSSFQYYYDGKVNIVGAKGGAMASGAKGDGDSSDIKDLFGKLKSYLDSTYQQIGNPQLAISNWMTEQSASIDAGAKSLFEKLGMDLGTTYSSIEVPSMAVDKWAAENKIEFGKGGKADDNFKVKRSSVGDKEGWHFSNGTNFSSALYKTKKEAEDKLQEYLSTGKYDWYGSAEMAKGGKIGFFDMLFGAKKKKGNFCLAYTDHLGYDKKEYYETKEEAKAEYDKRVKHDRWVSLDEWTGGGEPDHYGNPDDWKNLSYSDGIAKLKKGGSVKKSTSAKGGFASHYEDDGALFGGSYFKNNPVEKKGLGGFILGLGLGTVGTWIYKDRVRAAKEKVKWKMMYAIDRLEKGGKAGDTDLTSKEEAEIRAHLIDSGVKEKSTRKIIAMLNDVRSGKRYIGDTVADTDVSIGDIIESLKLDSYVPAEVMGKGGNAGVAKDRKYTSQEEHELGYKPNRKSRVRYYKKGD